MPQEHRPCQPQSESEPCENEEKQPEQANGSAKAKCKSAPKGKATAAKSKVRKTIGKKPQGQQEAGRSAKDSVSRVKRNALAEDKENTPPNAPNTSKVSKKPAQSKADDKPLTEKKKAREQKGDKIDKSPAEDKTFRPERNPGGRATGSGKPREQKVPQEEMPDPKAASQVAASLARANTTDIEDKEAKRKAYKARKQRFYNSLNSPPLKKHRMLKGADLNCSLYKKIVARHAQALGHQMFCGRKQPSPKDVRTYFGELHVHNSFVCA